MIASALAVELLASCLQHPLKHLAPSETNLSSGNDDDDVDGSCLGIIPHQVFYQFSCLFILLKYLLNFRAQKIRGYLHNYSTILPASQAFDKCTACSDKVKENYFLILLKLTKRIFKPS